MAAILDPKTRFFDMHITSEGRRQMSNGELRMRFVSFSDGYTSYEESEPGVIDRKDGEIFFEAMSRPQDSLISENPSIVNMLEIRKPGAQPAFLSNTIQVLADNDGIDNDGVEGIDQPGEMKTVTFSNASIFGEEIFVPPVGFTTQSIDTAGVGRIEIVYNPNESFYISGSETQEVYYNSKQNGLKGFWVFDRSVSQPVTGISEEPSSFLNILDKVSQNLSSSSYFGTNASYMERANNQHRNDSSPNLSSAAFLKTIANDKDNQKSYEGFAQGYIRICIDEYMYGRRPEGSGSSRYIVAKPGSYTPDSHNSRASDWDGVNVTSYGNRINSHTGYLDVSGWSQPPNQFMNSYSDFKASSATHGSYRYINQFSIWFYVKGSAFDSGNEQTIASFYATTTDQQYSAPRARIHTVRNQIFLTIYDDGNIVSTEENPDFTIRYGISNGAGPISPDTWHRVSFVYGTPYAQNETEAPLQESIAYLIVDGKLGNASSVRSKSIVSSKLLNISTVILGNFFVNSVGAAPGNLAGYMDPNNNNPKFLDGYIQSCEYYIQPATMELSRGTTLIPGTSGGYYTLPAYGSNAAFQDYINFKEGEQRYDYSGESPELDANTEHINDFLVRNRRRGSVITISNQPISVVEAHRRWIDYAPISAETALYFAGYLGNSYSKEVYKDRVYRRAEINEIVSVAEDAMSGTMRAYNQLNLLCHADSTGTENKNLTVKRYSMINEGTGLKRGRELNTGETRVFKTRTPEFPDREPVYGQRPNIYKENSANYPLVGGEGFESKFTGKVFLKEATVYHLEEIIDNEIDRDDTTVSSSRVPNFFFLPPIAASYFEFQGKKLEDGEETVRNTMTFRNFLKRRATKTSANLNSVISEKRLDLSKETLDSTFSIYKNLMKFYYKNLIPQDFTDLMLKMLYVNESEKFSDSNEDLIKYILRDSNDTVVYKNSTTFKLGEFTEVIEFTETSEFNNSFIQMFEVSEDEGKSKFSKLVIKDLGIIKKSALSLSGEDSAQSRYDNELIQESNLFDEGSEGSRETYSHVFVFGKLINKKENSPGTSIYFTPIFSLELELGGAE